MPGTTDQHGERIPSNLGEDVVAKLLHTHEIVDRPEKFAEMFCEVAKTQSAVREKLIEILSSAIQYDVESRKAVKQVLKELHDEDWKHFIRSAWGKIGLALWTAISVAIGIWVKSLIG